MAQSLISVRMDEGLKKSLEEICSELGMNVSTAITIFAKQVTREKRIPFEISADPFYSQANMAYLAKAKADMDAGKGVEHELIEVDE